MEAPRGVSWNAQARKGPKRERALAVLDYAFELGHLDRSRYGERRDVVRTALVQDLPRLVGDLPGPRWETVPPHEPVARPDRDLAVALLATAEGFGWLSGTDRKWRTEFAIAARSAADLLVLFLDIEPHLRDRDRTHPALTEPLARLAFVPVVHRARARARISRATFETLMRRAAAGTPAAELHAALADPPVEPTRPPATPEVSGTDAATNVSAGAPAPVEVGEERRVPGETPGAKVGEGVGEEVGEKRPEKGVGRGAGTSAEKVLLLAEADRARIVKYLERALVDERLDPGDYAARMLTVLAASTTAELAALVVDLPVPDEEPLRDRKADPRADDLIAPVDRQQVVDRLDRAMAGGSLSLWEYEALLRIVLDARTHAELEPAADRLPPPSPAPSEPN